MDGEQKPISDLDNNQAPTVQSEPIQGESQTLQRAEQLDCCADSDVVKDNTADMDKSLITAKSTGTTTEQIPIECDSSSETDNDNITDTEEPSSQEPSSITKSNKQHMNFDEMDSDEQEKLIQQTVLGEMAVLKKKNEIKIEPNTERCENKDLECVSTMTKSGQSNDEPSDIETIIAGEEKTGCIDGDAVKKDEETTAPDVAVIENKTEKAYDCVDSTEGELVCVRTKDKTDAESNCDATKNKIDADPDCVETEDKTDADSDCEAIEDKIDIDSDCAVINDESDCVKLSNIVSDENEGEIETITTVATDQKPPTSDSTKIETGVSIDATVSDGATDNKPKEMYDEGKTSDSCGDDKMEESASIYATIADVKPEENAASSKSEEPKKTIDSDSPKLSKESQNEAIDSVDKMPSQPDSPTVAEEATDRSDETMDPEIDANSGESKKSSPDAVLLAKQCVAMEVDAATNDKSKQSTTDPLLLAVQNAGIDSDYQATTTDEDVVLIISDSDDDDEKKSTKTDEPQKSIIFTPKDIPNADPEVDPLACDNDDDDDIEMMEIDPANGSTNAAAIPETVPMPGDAIKFCRDMGFAEFCRSFLDETATEGNSGDCAGTETAKDSAIVSDAEISQKTATEAVPPKDESKEDDSAVLTKIPGLNIALLVRK